MDTKTFEFDVTVEDLLDADSLAGLNAILDERMASQGIQHTATDISYEVKRMHEEDGADPLIIIVATYIPGFEGVDEGDMQAEMGDS